MSYRLTLDESPRDGLVRVIGEQLGKARDALADLDGDPEAEAVDAAVHDARKKLKKVRAALRLGRFGFGEAVYQRENIAARDLGRRLSDARDGRARLESLDALREAYDGPLDEAPFPTVRAALTARLEQRRREAFADDACSEMLATLDAIDARIAAADFEGKGFDPLGEGLARTWTRGRARRRDAVGGGEASDFHQWRKRARYSRYHLRLLAGLWPAVLEPWVDGMHRLTDVLGEAHDMVVLDATLAALAEGEAKDVAPREIEAVRALARARRRRLEAEAAPLGERLYAERAEAYVARLRGWWRAAQRGA